MPSGRCSSTAQTGNAVGRVPRGERVRLRVHVGRPRRVLVRRPLPEDASAWEAYGWRGAPEPGAAQAEHEAFCALLEEAGAEVVLSEHDPGNPDAIYTYDPTLVGRDGAVLLRPGKEGRRGEPEGTVAALE